MISASFTRGGDAPLVPICNPRMPGETLYDYLLRSRHEMCIQVRMLEAANAAQTRRFNAERQSWRRTLVMLGLSEAGFAAASVFVLDRTGLIATLPPPLTATIIGSGALGGAAIALGMASLSTRARSWARKTRYATRHFLRRCRCMAGRSSAPHQHFGKDGGAYEPHAWGSIPPSARADDDVGGDPLIDAIVEARTIDRLESQTFLWRLKLLALETAIVVTLFSVWRSRLGLPFPAVLDDALLVSGVCLIGGLVLALWADGISTGLVRLLIWWRRR